MFLSSLTCQQCPDFNFQIVKNLENNIIAKKKCEHFEVFLSVNIKRKNIFDDFKMVIQCKNCHTISNGVFTEREGTIQFKCKCGNDFLQLYYCISDNQKVFFTPKENPNGAFNINGKILNLVFIYESKKINYIVQSKDILKDHYEHIRKKVNFPDGKKILMNNNELSLNKTFEENNVKYNNIQLEIGD